MADAGTNQAVIPQYQTRVFNTWDDFKNGIRDALPGSHDYDVYKRFIFRGQGSAGWPLISTAPIRTSRPQAGTRLPRS